MHDTHTLLSKTITPALHRASAESLENTFLMDVWRRLVVSFILGKWSFSLMCAPGFLYHFFPSSCHKMVGAGLERFYCCFWNRLNKFSMLESIISRQFALGFAMLVHYTGRTEVLNKKDKFLQKKKKKHCLVFMQNYIRQVLFLL